MKRWFFSPISLLIAVVTTLTFTASPAQAQPSRSLPIPRHQTFSTLNIRVCDPANGPFSTNITNPYLPYRVGMVAVLEGIEDGTPGRLQIKVLNSTKTIAGVKTRVVEERAWEDGVLVEVARNYIVQAKDGTVCYYGEDVNYYDEAGHVIGHDGTWRAGNGNKPGILMPANPRSGQQFAQEDAPGVAEDQAKITSTGKTVKVPEGTFRQSLTIREWNPLEEAPADIKVYAPGVGLIKDNGLELVDIDGE